MGNEDKDNAPLDITLRVQNSDLTKALARWVHDGMGITKENLDQHLQQALDNHAKKFFELSFTKKRLEGLFAEFINSYFRNINWEYCGKQIKSLSDLADAMIRTEVKARVDKIIREIAEEYITITYNPKRSEEQ